MVVLRIIFLFVCHFTIHIEKISNIADYWHTEKIFRYFAESNFGLAEIIIRTPKVMYETFRVRIIIGNVLPDSAIHVYDSFVELLFA